MPVNLETALALRAKAYGGAGWDKTADQNIKACVALGFDNWNSMLELGFKSPNHYIEYLEGLPLRKTFKDEEVYERVKMLEDQSKNQTAIIVALDDKLMDLEKELGHHRDQILAIQHLLEVQMDQKNAEIEEANQAQEAEEQQRKKAVDMYDTLLWFFFPSITILVFAIIFSIYSYPGNSLHILENRTLIMDRSS